MVHGWETSVPGLALLFLTLVPFGQVVMSGNRGVQSLVSYKKLLVVTLKRMASKGSNRCMHTMLMGALFTAARQGTNLSAHQHKNGK